MHMDMCNMHMTCVAVRVPCDHQHAMRSWSARSGPTTPRPLPSQRTHSTRVPSPPTDGTAPAEDPWVFQRLRETLEEVRDARVESQHLQATTQTSLDRKAFSPMHDEQVLRFKAQACTSGLARLLSIIQTLEAQAEAALEAHANQETHWQAQLDETTSSGQLLLVELQRAEAELAKEAERTEQAVAVARDAHERRSAAELDAVRHEWAAVVAELESKAQASSAANDTLHEEAEALRAENARLREAAVQQRGEAARGLADALAKERAEVAEHQIEPLRAETTRLRQENGALRETATALRSELSIANEALAGERQAVTELRASTSHLRQELERQRAELERVVSLRERERHRINAYLAVTHDEVGAAAAAAWPQLAVRGGGSSGSGSPSSVVVSAAAKPRAPTSSCSPGGARALSPRRPPPLQQRDWDWEDE